MLSDLIDAPYGINPKDSRQRRRKCRSWLSLAWSSSYLHSLQSWFGHFPLVFIGILVAVYVSLSRPFYHVVDRDWFSIATSLAGQVALAWNWLLFSRREVLTCPSSRGTKRISKRRSRSLRYLTSSEICVCLLYSSTGISSQS